ncbi:MAG: phage portal protein [Ruminococcaceae bacterium]|nr:phage portal protein [Oscillospiraceae bacterium]
MGENKLNCRSIWQEYQKDLAYKNRLNLFDKTKQQQNFFLGRQWEGLNAPDLEKPVLNFVKRVVNYLISTLMVQDVAINLKSKDTEIRLVDALEKELEKINEASRFKTKLRNVIKNAAIDGDGAMFMRYNPETDTVESEVICNTNIVFGDRNNAEVEKQPYIIIVKKISTEMFRQQFPNCEVKKNYSFGFEEDDTVTVLIRLYKKNGTVHFIQSTEHQLLTKETDTGQKLYPVVYMNWETVRDSYHGMGAVETIIPNQIAVNKLWAMALLYQKNNAFPKVFIDKTKLDRWNSSPGAVMGVIGNPNDAVATSFRAGDMAAQLMAIVEKTISYTKDFMGANDAALGNVSPVNTSAIMALQKSSVAPLELQKMALYQLVEDYARIIYDIVRHYYGARWVELDGEQVYVDFGLIDENARLVVDIGPSEYWSETAQVSTLDNLFTRGIIEDAIIYLENIPSRMLPNKNKIIKQLKEKEEQHNEVIADGTIAEFADMNMEVLEDENV